MIFPSRRGLGWRRNATIGVYRPSISTFYLRNSNTTGLPDITVPFGDGPGGDLPDSWRLEWELDVDDWRIPSQYLDVLLAEQQYSWRPHISIPYGAPGDMAIVGDWDGNGTVTIVSFRTDLTMRSS